MNEMMPLCVQREGDDFFFLKGHLVKFVYAQSVCGDSLVNKYRSRRSAVKKPDRVNRQLI